jgi:hypothetical protein
MNDFANVSLINFHFAKVVMTIDELIIYLKPDFHLQFRIQTTYK